MAYTPYYPGGWQSGEEGGTPITPAALNHIEQGIANLEPGDIGAAQHIKFESTDTTAALIYNKINDFPLQTTVAVYVPGTVMNILTDGKMALAAYGTMTKFDSSGSYRFLLARANGQYLYGFDCTITSSAVTPGTVYQYSGTVI